MVNPKSHLKFWPKPMNIPEPEIEMILTYHWWVGLGKITKHVVLPCSRNTLLAAALTACTHVCLSVENDFLVSYDACRACACLFGSTDKYDFWRAIWKTLSKWRVLVNAWGQGPKWTLIKHQMWVKMYQIYQGPHL